MKKLMILVLVLGVSGLASAADWTAYNDCSPYGAGVTTTANVTNHWETFGELVKYSDGTSTGVTISWDKAGAYEFNQNLYPAAGTDMDTVFTGIVNLNGVNAGQSGSPITYTFNGLDDSKTYEIVIASIRGGRSANDRGGNIELLGAVSSTYACSAGAPKLSETKVTIDQGYNDVLGHVAGWTDIAVDSSGEFSIEITRAYGSWYGINAVQLTQVPEPATMLILGLGGLFLRRRK